MDKSIPICIVGSMSKQIGIPRILTSRSAVTATLSILFVACWSSGFIGAKLGAGSAEVPTLLMWRFLPLAVVLVPIVGLSARRRNTMPTPRALGRQVVIGMLSQSGYLLSVYWAVDLGVNTGTTALIDGIQPLVAAALLGPVLGVAVPRMQWVGLVIGLGGVAMVTAADAGAGASAPWWAYAIPFLGMVSLVASTFVQQRAHVRATTAGLGHPLLNQRNSFHDSCVRFCCRTAECQHILDRIALVDRVVYLRRLRPVLVVAASHRHHVRQHLDVLDRSGHRGLGRTDVRRILHPFTALGLAVGILAVIVVTRVDNRPKKQDEGTDSCPARASITSR
ncbi:hypothetical protein GCM10020255_029080 [Rhodococcus baikonurensis]